MSAVSSSSGETSPPPGYGAQDDYDFLENMVTIDNEEAAEAYDTFPTSGIVVPSPRGVTYAEARPTEKDIATEEDIEQLGDKEEDGEGAPPPWRFMVWSEQRRRERERSARSVMGACADERKARDAREARCVARRLAPRARS